MKRCTGLALLVLLAGCGGGSSPSAPSTPAPTPTPVPINGLAVLVSSAGYFTGLTAGAPTGPACGKLTLTMTIRETRGGPVQPADFAYVITDSAGVRTRWQATFAGHPAFAPNSVSSVYVTIARQCVLMPATWDFRVNTADVAGTVTQLHGSGKIEIR